METFFASCPKSLRGETASLLSSFFKRKLLNSVFVLPSYRESFLVEDWRFDFLGLNGWFLEESIVCMVSWDLFGVILNQLKALILTYRGLLMSKQCKSVPSLSIFRRKSLTLEKKKVGWVLWCIKIQIF